LAGLADDRWRELLRAMIKQIVFHGNSIKIEGRIPIDTIPNVDVSVTQDLALDLRSGAPVLPTL